MNVIRSRKLFGETQAEFLATFGVPLSDFWDIKTPYGIAVGFDIMEFDDKIIHSGDERMSTVVMQRYGKDAAKLLVRIMKG